MEEAAGCGNESESHLSKATVNLEKIYGVWELREGEKGSKICNYS